MSVVEYAVADRVARIGAARRTPEGYAFQTLAARAGFKAAVKTRDEPFAAGS